MWGKVGVENSGRCFVWLLVWLRKGLAAELKLATNLEGCRLCSSSSEITGMECTHVVRIVSFDSKADSLWVTCISLKCSCCWCGCP